MSNSVRRCTDGGNGNTSEKQIMESAGEDGEVEEEEDEEKEGVKVPLQRFGCV